MVVGLAAQFLHLTAATVWIGGVFFVTFSVLPAARDGRLEYKPATMFLDRFSKVSLVSALVLFFTGGHMAGTRYTFEALTSTADGVLVLVMLALWAVLLGLLQIGHMRLRKQSERGYLVEPVKSALLWYRAAAVVALLILAGAVLLTYQGDITFTPGTLGV